MPVSTIRQKVPVICRRATMTMYQQENVYLCSCKPTNFMWFRRLYNKVQLNTSLAFNAGERSIVIVIFIILFWLFKTFKKTFNNVFFCNLLYELSKKRLTMFFFYNLLYVQLCMTIWFELDWKTSDWVYFRFLAGTGPFSPNW